MGADGSFTLRGVSVACPATDGTCTVDVTATQSSGASAKRVLALAHFKLKAGHTSAVKLKLNKRGRKLLARKHSLKLTVRLKVREANGVRASHTFKVKIRPKKKHAH